MCWLCYNYCVNSSIRIICKPLSCTCQHVFCRVVLLLNGPYPNTHTHVGDILKYNIPCRSIEAINCEYDERYEPNKIVSQRHLYRSRIKHLTLNGGFQRHPTKISNRSVGAHLRIYFIVNFMMKYLLR